MLYGDSLRSCTVAIIVPNLEKVHLWATANGKFILNLNDVGFDPKDVNQVLVN